MARDTYNGVLDLTTMLNSTLDSSGTTVCYFCLFTIHVGIVKYDSFRKGKLSGYQQMRNGYGKMGRIS